MFITFEGGEGTGKTTQIKLLADYLEEKLNKKVVKTREPGGTDPAVEIRKILLEGKDNKWNPEEEIGLFYVARSHHIRNLIKPELEKGNVVISDRFYDSTFSYQKAKGTDALLQKIHDMFVGDFKPDLTIVLDIDPKKGLLRSYSREGNKEVRFEDKGLKFHTKVRENFLQIVKENPDRCILIDASGSVEDVHNKIITRIKKDGKIEGLSL